MPSISDSAQDPDELQHLQKDDKLVQDFLQNKDNIESRERSEHDTRTVTCYNHNCPDYRVERPWDTSCGCKRTQIKGAGDKFPF